jgi:hypothetical protein
MVLVLELKIYDQFLLLKKFSFSPLPFNSNSFLYKFITHHNIMIAKEGGEDKADQHLDIADV